MFRLDHLFERFKTGGTVISNFADKMGLSICVEMTIEIVSWSPEVIFGYFRCFLSAFEDVLTRIGRAWQVGPKRVKASQHLWQNFAADTIVVGLSFE